MQIYRIPTESFDDYGISNFFVCVFFVLNSEQ